MRRLVKSSFLAVSVGLLLAPHSGLAKAHKQSVEDDAPAEVKKLFKDARCSSQVNELVKQWGASGQWIRSAGDMDGGKAFSSPTARVGTWVQLAFYPNHSVEARKITDQAAILAGWKAQDCTPWVKPSIAHNDDKSVGPLFRDNDLQKLVDDKGSALVYAWSPHMALSVLHFAEAQQLAHKLNIEFVPLLDPEADSEAAKKAAAAHSIPETALRRDATLELAMRGMHIHFPTSIVVSKGHISKLYPGLWVNKEVYEKFVKGNLQ